MGRLSQDGPDSAKAESGQGRGQIRRFALWELWQWADFLKTASSFAVARRFAVAVLKIENHQFFESPRSDERVEVDFSKEVFQEHTDACDLVWEPDTVLSKKTCLIGLFFESVWCGEFMCCFLLWFFPSTTGR